MVFGDLAAEHQADAGALRLGGEKRDEEILETGDAGTVVFDGDFEHAAIEAPGQADARFGVAGGALFEGGIDGVFEQVDQHLLDLSGVDLHDDVRAAFVGNRDAGFEPEEAADQGRDLRGGECGLRELGEA